MKKLIIFITAITIIIFITAISTSVFPRQSRPEPKAEQPKPQHSVQVKESDPPQIVSTRPDPLDETIIPAQGPIEITFNRSLQNVPEFKIRFEPKIDYRVELSPDRRTAKIIFNKPLDLGSSFNLYINPDTKFDEIGEWKESKTFHFRTIKYTGV